ncbi:probable beige protein homolog [Rhynchosporium secalis]|uniref:Probable beige protein homolog n=1 Tax=Rhynchosporium secalis TaxID=38038 RepID=A0A1E1MGX7_RHYSE|nr:probable beige protein homolog [Rhynchosporium secalis]
MSMTTRRPRSSTATSTPPESTKATAEIQLLLDNLSQTLRTRSDSTYPDLPTLTDQSQNIRQYLIASSETGRACDDFRHLYGFQILLDSLRAFSGFYHPTKRSKKDKTQLFCLLESILGILGQTFREHYGNERYFKRRVEGGGWAALEQAIASIGIGGSESDPWSEAQLLGCLLSFALDDKRLETLCQTVIERHTAEKQDNKTVANAEDIAIKDKSVLEIVNTKLEEILGDHALLYNSDIVPTIVDFWATVPRQPNTSVNPAALVVIQVLKKVGYVSKHNLMSLHSTGILSTLLPLAFDSDILGSTERESVESLCASLISLGITSLSDAQYLICSKSPKAADFLLQSMKESHGPSYIQFDLSLHGFASIELPTLGRAFPPPSTSAGYTFAAWIYIDQFDAKSFTTIFGAFDASQTCFLLAYFDEARNFILQTSVVSSRPSVRFKSTVFRERRWYHIAIVHRRARTLTASKASLYVDGEFAEEVKCQYPAAPPTNASTDSFTSFTSSASKSNPVQGFVGTPRDLSSKLGPGVVFSRWSLASFHLFEDVLSDDLIAVYFRLGPRYKGNFQDCLGSFQTYEASAALGMRNDLIHPGKEETSDILSAIRDKASNMVPESRIILSILPTAVLRDDDRHKYHESLLLRGLNQASSSNLFQLTHNSGTAVVVNAAVPSINEALIRQHGTSILTGDPVVVVPQSLDDAMWRLGGFAGIALKMVENANTKDDIVRAVETLFESIKGSWRNSEAMERENGYAILGALIRGKVGAGVVVSSKLGPEPSLMDSDDREKLGFQLLSLVLDFVGYDHQKPEESFIINPLAYRILLVDFDMWRKSAAITQKLYYKQFVVFGVNSKFHQFNSRRLFRMRIVKKFLDALKAEAFSHEVFPSFMEALKSLVICNLTSEIFRFLALFITYAYHKPAISTSRTPKTVTGTRPSRSGSSSQGPKRPSISTILDGRDIASNTSLTRRQIGNRILAMYSDLLCDKANTSNIRKFARTVTNKWLLHLLTEDDPEVVVHGTKILARLLVVHGSGYVTKFASKTGGFAIMRFRLRRWWDLPTLWPICFSILFGRDVAEVDLEAPFELFSLLEPFSNCKIVYPGVLPVIMSMLQHGLKEVLHHQDDPDSPLLDRGNSQDKSKECLIVPAGANRRRSMSLTKELEARQTHQHKKERLSGQATVLHTVIRFFADLHSKSSDFRDFAISSDYIRHLLAVLFPIVVSTDAVSPETELNSRDSALTFEGDDVIIRPISRVSTTPTPIVRTSSVETMLPPSPTAPRARPLRRGSSFILLTSRPSEFSPSSARLNVIMSPKKKLTAQNLSNSLVEELLELVINVFIDQVMIRKEFPGFNLCLKVPPGFQEHQAYFESYLLRNTIPQLNNTIQLDQKSLREPKLIQNTARFVSHIGEAVFEGWFLSGAESLLDFAGTQLEYLQRPEISKIKSVRLCSQAVTSVKNVFLRVVLLRLSELDNAQVPEDEAVAFMDKLLYWQAVLLSSDVSEDNFLKLICYQLYLKLVDSRDRIRLAAANLWRIILVQKPEETSTMFHNTTTTDHRTLASGFRKLMEQDNETFFSWVDEQRVELDALFLGAMSKTWEDFVNAENEKTEDAAKTRVSKRREKLRQWHAEELNDEDILFRHDLASTLWMKNIYSSEHLKHQRAQQDQQDNFTFLASTFSRMNHELHRPCAVFEHESSGKWKLDRTEGRNRMRLRMLPDREAPAYDYQPKRRVTDAANTLKMNTKVPVAPGIETPVSALRIEGVLDGPSDRSSDSLANSQQEAASGSQGSVMPEEDFELVDDPNDPGEDDTYEDKNRKVMRSLQQGDQVQQVFNISRIIGLEACEGLLIIGKNFLYLIDNVFQRSDGEIVNVLQAPKEERDPYLQMIAGKNPADKRAQPVKADQGARADQEARSWKWSDVLSISKRRFLFRDVAIEVFFTDGRSYLLTAISPHFRDELYSKLTSKAPHTSGSSSLPNPEDGWRLEALKVSEEAPASFGSKFGNIFNSSAWNPAMRRWAKGEMSNFHYLMLVNTMAGRTFNDLTQYPVFPWVLADYTSEELDLDNPATFRDLSKPMGAQHNSRAAEYIERYKTFAEMGDANTPAFHYGTHYSSAMIVTSYLIRLQPFVQSYLLLQGGNFDHPDRLFYSIEKAWQSASKDNMTDVRELIPEFFYLPEFLTNNNSYNFGLRQGNGGGIDTVKLPPWAKGDPKIFIAKHREALESPYVSRYLNQWIDLIFGCKQRGEAAIDSVNVFHHLSYHGAKDLDNIVDPIERVATIGIIHNFGQTPHQVFSKPHQAREDTRNKARRLDTSAGVLTRLPFPLLESQERVANLIYSAKLDRLLCATAFRLNLAPHFDKFVEWGFADNSIRFQFNDSSRKSAGLFENLHVGQISTCIFASSQLLITAGEDCVISAHTVITSPSKPVDLTPRSSLFGHKTPVTVLAVSKSFSTLLSASQDGTVILWDLNRLEFVRKLSNHNNSSNSRGPVECARINDVTGDIMLCRGQKVTLYTLNGEFLLEQNVCDNHDDYIASCAWYEGTGNEWVEHSLCFTGQRGGIVNIWRKAISKTGKWQLELVKKLEHGDTRGKRGETAVGSLTVAGGSGRMGSLRGRGRSSLGGRDGVAVTCVRPMAQCVYTGDEEGRVVSYPPSDVCEHGSQEEKLTESQYEWDIVQRER